MKTKIEKAWMCYNYKTPLYYTTSRTKRLAWDSLEDFHKELYYQAYARGDEDCITIKKIEFYVADKTRAPIGDKNYR